MQAGCGVCGVKYKTHEILIIDDEDDILGNIVLFVFENVDPYESELVVGYEDMDGLIKAEKKHTDDL